MPRKHRRLRVVSDNKVLPPDHERHDLTQVICRVCEKDAGVASSQFMETHLGLFEEGGEILTDESTRTLICVNCLSRGKITRFS